MRSPEVSPFYVNIVILQRLTIPFSLRFVTYLLPIAFRPFSPQVFRVMCFEFCLFIVSCVMLQCLTVSFAFCCIAYLLRIRFLVLLMPTGPTLSFVSVGDIASFFIPVVVGAGGVLFAAVVAIGAAGFAGCCATHDDDEHVVFGLWSFGSLPGLRCKAKDCFRIYIFWMRWIDIVCKA